MYPLPIYMREFPGNDGGLEAGQGGFDGENLLLQPAKWNPPRACECGERHAEGHVGPCPKCGGLAVNPATAGTVVPNPQMRGF